MNLGIRNWSKYQHYKNRPGSPWVKLYVSLLDDEDFCAMPVASRLAGCMLLIVASKRSNRFPDSPGWLAAELHITQAQAKRALADLLALRFLVPASELASNSASTTASNPASENASGSASNGASASRAHDRALRAEVEIEVETAEQSSYVLQGDDAALPEESLEELGQRLEARSKVGGDGSADGTDPGTPGVRQRGTAVPAPIVPSNGRAPYGSVDSVYEVIDRPAKNTRPELEKWLGQLEPHQVEHVREQTLACEPRKSKAAYAVGTAQRLARAKGTA